MLAGGQEQPGWCSQGTVGIAWTSARFKVCNSTLVSPSVSCPGTVPVKKEKFMHSQHFGHWFPHKHSFLSTLQLHQIACFLSKQHMNEHSQCKPYIPNNKFCTGNPDPILTLVAMVLCRLGGQQGRMMWGWHISLLLLLGQGPASLFPPLSLHPTAAGSSLHLLIRSSGQAAASDASLGLCPGGGTVTQAPKAVPLQTRSPILWLHALVLDKPSSSCSWVLSRLPLLIPH